MTSATESIEVRDTLVSDLPEIFRIRNDPAVRPSQYKVNSDDSVEVWSKRLSNDDQDGPVTFHCSTVLLGDDVIGHVTSHRFRFDQKNTAQCGWNLDPEFWGRGLMGTALTMLFGQFFSSGKIDQVIADCFRGNRRCKRLMSKLGFVPVRISLQQRFQIACTTSSWKWIDRFELDPESFDTRSRSESDTLRRGELEVGRR